MFDFLHRRCQRDIEDTQALFDVASSALASTKRLLQELETERKKYHCLLSDLDDQGIIVEIFDHTPTLDGPFSPYVHQITIDSLKRSRNLKYNQYTVI